MNEITPVLDPQTDAGNYEVEDIKVKRDAAHIRARPGVYVGDTGPRTAGFDSDRWTTARFAEAIYGRFGVRYDPDHAGRIMHRLGLRERRRTRRIADVHYTFVDPVAVPEAQAEVAKAS